MGLRHRDAVAVLDVFESDDLVAGGRLQDPSGPRVFDYVDGARLGPYEEGARADVAMVAEALGGAVEAGVPPTDAVG